MTELSNGRDDELADFDFSHQRIQAVEPAVASTETSATDIAISPVSQEMPESGFDYSEFGKEFAVQAEQTAERIRERLRVSMIECGNDLLAIKEKLKHGKFGDWLACHFTFSERTAQNMMNAARAFGSVPKLVDMLPDNLIYKLSANGTPADFRQMVIDGFLAGQELYPADVEQRLMQAKAIHCDTREAARIEKVVATARNEHEKELRKAKKSDDEVAAALKRWDAKQAEKVRQAAIKPKTVSVSTPESDVARESNPVDYSRMKLSAESIQSLALTYAAHLKTRFGENYQALIEAMTKIDSRKNV